MNTAAELHASVERIKAREPYLGVRVSDDRRRIIALRHNITGAEIIAGCDDFGCNDVYSYETTTHAAMAWIEWSGDVGTEPGRWIRHMPSARRRPDGDATKEYVSP